MAVYETVLEGWLGEGVIKFTGLCHMQRRVGGAKKSVHSSIGCPPTLTYEHGLQHNYLHIDFGEAYTEVQTRHLE
jgi:hypothetical protein